MIRREDFDLVLLDVMMPGISGIDVLTSVRKQLSESDLPIIMATARDASEDIVAALKLGANDYVTKPLDFPVVLARVHAQLTLKRQKEQIQKMAEDLEVRNRFIQNTFGRYLSDEIVSSLLESPEGLKLGGESRTVTIVMSDLRGFTAVSERLGPEQVVSLLNLYLGVMADIIMRYNGTIDEFIGDAILAIFGAPMQREDDAARGLACAVAMQNAMTEVNHANAERGLPRIEMGVAIHTGEVVVGNIGSHKRAKYGVVGPPVNLAGRIESYTVGGQILVSEAAIEAAGRDMVRVGERLSIVAKGSKEPIAVYELRGVGGEYEVSLEEREDAPRRLAEPVQFRFQVLEGKHVAPEMFDGVFVKLSSSGAEMRTDRGLRPLSNLKIILAHGTSEAIDDVYAKVVEVRGEEDVFFGIRFTSVPPAAEAWLAALLASAPGDA
jgi:adenylate cyclase